MKIIMKFGGTSLADGKKLSHVSNLITDQHKKNDLIIVNSALHDITDQLSEISNNILDYDPEAAKTFINSIRTRHLKALYQSVTNKKLIIEIENKINLILEELENVFLSVIYLKELTPKSKDHILSFGERLSNELLYGNLKEQNIPVKSFTGGEAGIITDACFTEANLLSNLTNHEVKKVLSPLIKKGIIPIITGFNAVTQDGVITTLGRGGSDYTATILGVALEADEIWIWTDVDGLMTADPKIVSQAKQIKSMSLPEAMELAVFGAKVIYPRSLEPAINHNLKIRLKNTFNPKNPGTLISNTLNKGKTDVKAVSLIKNSGLITIIGSSMISTPGTAAKILDILGKKGIKIQIISQSASEAYISLVTSRDDLHNAVNTLEFSLLGRGTIKEIISETNVSIVAVIGAEMQGIPGIAARVFTAVAKNNINIKVIAQGSSEYNISFVVNEKDANTTVQTLHKEFQLEKTT